MWKGKKILGYHQKSDFSGELKAYGSIKLHEGNIHSLAWIFSLKYELYKSWYKLSSMSYTSHGTNY